MWRLAYGSKGQFAELAVPAGNRFQVLTVWAQRNREGERAQQAAAPSRSFDPAINSRLACHRIAEGYYEARSFDPALRSIRRSSSARLISGVNAGANSIAAKPISSGVRLRSRSSKNDTR